MVFVRDGVLLISLAGLDDACVHLLPCLAIVANHDHAFARVRSRPPQPIALVSANRVGETVLPSKVIDSGRVTIVLPVNAAFRALFGRQPVVDERNGTGHLRPAEHVGILLRKLVEAHRFPLLRRDTQRVLVRDESLDRHHGHGKRPPNHSVQQDKCEDGGAKCGLEPCAFGCRPPQQRLDGNRASREEWCIDRGEVIRLSLEDDEGREDNNPHPAERAKTMARLREKAPKDAAKPNRKRQARKDYEESEHAACIGPWSQEHFALRRQ